MKSQEIINEIKRLEKKEKIKILFLIESGSRGWGWESKDSDYDVRGVYKQDYLKVDDPKEQINLKKGALDLELWGIKKFLRLMKKSNPSAWEWLSSEIIYLDDPLRKKLKKIFEKQFSQEALKKHYISMARQNFEKYIKDAEGNANLKKYVYVLRSVACVLWISRYKLPPPKNYKKVIIVLPKEIQDFFNKIVKDKKESESVYGKKDKKIDKYILNQLSQKFEKSKDSFNSKQIEKIFKNIIK